MLTYLNIVIGSKQDLPVETYCVESQSFLKVKDLRMHINELYNTRLKNREEEIFDLMLFRDMSKQLFWNCIFHMIEYKMPYDFILPYKVIGLIQNLKFANRHIFISETEKEEGFQIPIRERRHKSNIPQF